ncbi:hypothetical protein AOLI_G00090870 [Acnodon oligacanthus]
MWRLFSRCGSARRTQQKGNKPLNTGLACVRITTLRSDSSPECDGLDFCSQLGDITQKGYEKKRGKLLAPYIPQIQGVDPSLQVDHRIQASSQAAPPTSKHNKPRAANSRDERFRSDLHTEAVQAALAKYKERKMPMPSKRRSVLVQSSVEACTPPGTGTHTICSSFTFKGHTVGLVYTPEDLQAPLVLSSPEYHFNACREAHAGLGTRARVQRSRESRPNSLTVLEDGGQKHQTNKRLNNMTERERELILGLSLAGRPDLMF